MAGVVTLNYAGMRALLRSSKVERMLSGRMERVLAVAQANAPVASGDYRDGLHIEVVQHPTRVTVRVVGSTDHDLVIESRTGNLARSLDAAG